MAIGVLIFTLTLLVNIIEGRAIVGAIKHSTIAPQKIQSEEQVIPREEQKTFVPSNETPSAEER